MGKLQDRINAASQRLETARSNQDQEAERRAQAELDTLRELDSQGLGFSQSDLDSTAGNTRTEGRTAGQSEERTRWLQSLGLSSDATDEQAQQAVQSYQEWQRGQQSEVQNVTQERDTRQQERDTAITERDSAAQRAEAAENALNDERINNALQSALLAEGVVHGSGENESRLDAAMRMADRSQVQVQVDNEGNFTGVENVQAAAQGVKTSYPEWFADTQAQFPRTPNSQQRTQQQGSSYRPRYSIPGR